MTLVGIAWRRMTPTALAPFVALLPIVLGSPRKDEAVPAPVAKWLASAPLLLAALEHDADPAVWATLRSIAGDARIVALGEATHGSHEFFAFKARAVEFLVRELGFTDFAMETGFTNALDTNAWVERGEGDLEHALRGLAGQWQTEEYRELLLWLRAWNADAAHAKKVRIHGLDMQVHSGEAAGAVKAYFERVDPGVAEAMDGVLRDLGNLGRVDESDRTGIVGIFDELHDEFVARSSQREWELARQTAIVLVQRYLSTRKSGNDGTAFRDRCMADNARWILRTYPGSKLVLSAHNGHVSKAGLFEIPGYGVIESVGRALTQDRAKTKDEDLSMVVIGAAFATGGFYAFPARGGGNQAFEITTPKTASHESALASVLSAPVLLDLRAAPAEARAWLDTPRYHIGPGGAWDPAWLEEEGQSKLTTLPAEYDALFFVPHVTPARLLQPPK
jgi:erythromycin esterase